MKCEFFDKKGEIKMGEKRKDKKHYENLVATIVSSLIIKDHKSTRGILKHNFEKDLDHIVRKSKIIVDKILDENIRETSEDEDEDEDED